MTHYTLMQKVEDRLHKLDIIKGHITPEYLEKTPLQALKTKVSEINGLVSQIKEIWEKTNIEDYPDKDTVGWESKKDVADEKATEIKKLINDRIIVLEKALNTKLIAEMDEVDQKIKNNFEAVTTEKVTE